MGTLNKTCELIVIDLCFESLDNYSIHHHVLYQYIFSLRCRVMCGLQCSCTRRSSTYSTTNDSSSSSNGSYDDDATPIWWFRWRHEQHDANDDDDGRQHGPHDDDAHDVYEHVQGTYRGLYRDQ